jgi:UDP-N-acetylmuramoyl-tripeptide--D-alanyl-D-alanine ligase
MSRIIQLLLKFLAKIIIKKYQPEVIGITGSLGKTSAKEAIYAVLKNKFNVRQSPKNYNNELSVPLTILGTEAPGRSLKNWLNIFGKFFRLLIIPDKNYPPILILEMGVDRPGDMKYLTSIIQPNIGVITAVKNSHLEFFEKEENIKKEKQILIENLTRNGLAVLNYDNIHTRDMIKESKFKTLTYGLAAGADIQAQEINWVVDRGGPDILGINFKVSYEGSLVPVNLPRVAGLPAVYAVLAAIAVGTYYEMNLVEIAHSLLDFALPPGRLNLLPGIKNSRLLDDTYNSSPASTLVALEIIAKAKLPGGRKIVVLGDMLELGSVSESGHGEVGEKIAQISIDLLVVVGQLAKIVGLTAAAAGFPAAKIIYLADSNMAAAALTNIVAPHDLILVKGSQGARMEKVVKSLMAEPERAQNLLVRQGKEWDNH